MKARTAKSGFTLVEMLIVVVIMGILAAIVVPQFSQSSDDARYAASVQNLQTLRSQIDLFRNQHENRFPGGTANSSDDTTFKDQMTLPTDESGTTGPFNSTSFPYGPYIHTNIPANPFNGSRKVQNTDNIGAVTADETQDVGWVYERTSGRIRVNKSGTIPGSTTVTYWEL